jgi:HK97 family phage major capsid protein
MPRRHYEVRDALEQAEKAKTRLEEEASALRARVSAGEDNDGTRERLANVERGVERKDVELAELKGELGQALTEAMARGEVHTETAEFPVPRQSREPVEHGQHVRVRDGAMRTIERHVKGGNLTAQAADRVDGVLRGGDAGLGLDAAYIEAAGSPEYERAFHKLLRFGDGAVLRMTPEEQQAVQKVNRAEEMRTALTVGSGAGGGFALPITVDATINLSSNGAINPIRALADVRTMSTRELRLVTSDGVIAQYQAEAAEAIDNSPVLAQPTLIAQRATSFVPFSFEVDQDWSSVAAELAQLIADAKDVLEATKFLLGAGSGSSEPVGILTIGTTGALTTTQRVLSAGAGAVAIGDVYALKQALGQTRFAQTATWAFNPTRLDAVYRLTPSGSTTEPQIMTDRNGPLLGRPTAEWSTMATAVTTGSKWALYGDFKQGYVIGDRLGMTLDIIPHLFGATNRYPTGQRGAFAIWRNDGKCKSLNALRYGETS